jgi:hypothetical protein
MVLLMVLLTVLPLALARGQLQCLWFVTKVLVFPDFLAVVMIAPFEGTPFLP